MDLTERLLTARDADYETGTWLCRQGVDEVKRLRAALERIDGINDNPAIYNPDIEAVLRAALDN